MGKFDQVLEKAKANGLIRPLEREQKVRKPSSAGEEKEPELAREPLPLLEDEESDSVVRHVPMELTESKRDLAGKREISEPEPQKSLGVSAADSQGVGKKAHPPWEDEQRLGVQAEGRKEEAEKTVVIVDRETIARSLNSLRAGCGQGSSNDSAKEFMVTKGKEEKHAVTLIKPSSAFAEYFRVIRTRILYTAKERSARVILITSSMPKEGKSFTASNLAVSIANGLDQPVLLIDADFRKPSLHATFGLGATAGLSDYLGDERYQLSTVIQNTSFPKLAVLPAGSCTEGSSELLAFDVMRVFLQHVKYEDEGRYIIVDGPPSQISETLALSKLADCTVLVVRAGVGDMRTIKRTVDSIGSNKILGIILNYSNSKLNDYYHYYRKAK